MTALTESEGQWVDDLAGCLRLIQAGAAAVPAEKRREYLEEEVGRRLKELPVANRKRFLTALVARFPVYGRWAGSAVSAVPEPPPSKPAEETPEQILERFLTAVATVPEERRVQMSRRLAESGLTELDRNAAVVEISNDLRQKLGLPAGQQVHLTRLLDLALVLAETLSRLDQRALATLRELSSRSPLLKRPQDFRAAAVRFLASENEPLEPHLRPVTALLGALMAATLAGGKEFGKQHYERFSPAVIEGVITIERGKIFGPSKKERCWDRYTELANDYVVPEIIDRQIKDCLAKFVERIVGSP